MKKTLYFEGAGWENTYRGEVTNCRIRTAFTNNNDEKIYLEILGYEKSKDDEKKYKRYPEYNVGDAIGIIDACFYITDDPEVDDENYSRLPYERKGNISYSYNGLLEFVNKKLNCSFDEVVILPWLSGYNVHSGKGRYNTSERYNFIEDFNYIPERTVERRKTYYEVATEYFDKIYQRNAKEKGTERLYKPMQRSHGILEMDDDTMTIRSHTYKELINDNERVKTFEIVY